MFGNNGGGAIKGNGSSSSGSGKSAPPVGSSSPGTVPSCSGGPGSRKGGGGGGGGGGRNSLLSAGTTLGTTTTSATTTTNNNSTNLEPWSLKQLESLFDYNRCTTAVHAAPAPRGGGGGGGGGRGRGGGGDMVNFGVIEEDEEKDELVPAMDGSSFSPSSDDDRGHYYDHHHNNSSNSRNKKTNKKSRTTTIIGDDVVAEDSKHHNSGDDDCHDDSHVDNPIEDQFVASLRSSISEMTMYDHHRANFDKYGVSTTIPDETPEEIQMWMSEMDIYLEILATGGSIGGIGTGLFGGGGGPNNNESSSPPSSSSGKDHNNNTANGGGGNANRNGRSRSKSIRTALGTAMDIDLGYVKSLRMSFLRAEDWNTKLASKCMARYFDQKWKYFGSPPPPPPNDNNNKVGNGNSSSNKSNSNSKIKSNFASLIHNFTPRPNGGGSRNEDEGGPPKDSNHDDADQEDNNTAYDDDDDSYYSILTRPVTISDLTEEEIDVWKRTGVVQWLSERDRAGRPVMVMFGKEQFDLPETTVIRIGFVLVEMIIRDDVEIQKVGYVQIYYAMSQTEFDNARARRIVQSVYSQPLRCVGRHYVYDTQRMFGLMIEAHRVMDPFERLRFVPHRVSTHQECCYNLMTYGISAESLPIKEEVTTASTASTTTSGEQHGGHEKQKNNNSSKEKKNKSEKFIIDTEFNESMIDALLREERIKQQQQQQQNLLQNQVVVGQQPTSGGGKTRDSNMSANSTDSDIQGVVDMLLDEVVPIMGDYDKGGAARAAQASAVTTPDQGYPRDSTMSVNLRDSFWKAIGLGGGEDDNDEIAESAAGGVDTAPSSLAAAATAAAAGFHEVVQEESLLAQQRQQHQQHYCGVNMSGIRTTGGGSMGLEMPAPPPARPVVPPHPGQPGKLSPVITGGTGSGVSSTSSSRNRGGMIIIVPGPEDVIMGRGRHNKNKPGNRKLQSLLLEYSSRYEAADKYKKKAIAETVLRRMLDTGSRFLIRGRVDDGGCDDASGGEGNTNPKGKKKQTKKGIWVDVTPEKARDKIAHDFRNLRSAAAAAAAASSTTPGVGKTSQSSTSTSNTEKRRRPSFANDAADDDDVGQVIGSSGAGGSSGSSDSGQNNMFSSWFR